MKRVNSETIHANVLQYLKTRNYVEPSTESFSKKHFKLTETVEELAARMMLQGETGSRNPVSCDGSNSSPDESSKQFAHFAAFVRQALPEYQIDIENFIFPIFVHLFLEMIYNDHKAEAHSFYVKHQELVESFSSQRELLHSLTEVMTSIDILTNPMLMTFRECKYKVEISHDAMQYLLRYLQSRDVTLILKVLNFHIHIEVKHVTSTNTQSVTPEREDTKALSKAPIEQDEEEQEHSVPPQTDVELNKILEAVREGPPMMPSILMYSFINTYQGLCCSSLSQDDNILVGGYEDSSMRIWSTGAEKLKTIHSPVDISRVYLAGDCVTTTDETSKGAPPSDYQVLRGHSGPVYSCSFVPQSDLLLSCSEDSTVRVWNLSSQCNAAVYRGHNYPVWDVDVSPANTFFASASKDGTTRLWSFERTYPLRVYCGHLMDVDCVKFHPNCKYMATGSNDKSVRMWDIREARSVRLFTGHRSTVLSLAFSPDGNYLASAGEDRRIKLWDLGSGSMVKELRGHADTVYSLGFSPDSSMLASGGIDNSIRIWDIRKNISHKTSESSSAGTSPELLKQYPTKSVHIHHLQFIKANLLTAVGGNAHN